MSEQFSFASDREYANFTTKFFSHRKHFTNHFILHESFSCNKFCCIYSWLRCFSNENAQQTYLFSQFLLITLLTTLFSINYVVDCTKQLHARIEKHSLLSRNACTARNCGVFSHVFVVIMTFSLFWLSQRQSVLICCHTDIHLENWTSTHTLRVSRHLVFHCQTS